MLGAKPAVETAAEPQLDGNGGVVACPQELAGIGSTKAAELLVVVVLGLRCLLPGADFVGPGPGAPLESSVVGPLLSQDGGLADAAGEVVRRVVTYVYR